MKPEDQLIDALLKEQARNRDADEQLLASIDKALDEEGDARRDGVSKWRRALPLSIAAGLAIGGAVIYQRVHDDSPREAIGMGPMPEEPSTTGVPAVSAPPAGADGPGRQETAMVELMDVAEAEAASRGSEALPAELIEGTPKPIRLPERTPGSSVVPRPAREETGPQDARDDLMSKVDAPAGLRTRNEAPPAPPNATVPMAAPATDGMERAKLGALHRPLDAPAISRELKKQALYEESKDEAAVLDDRGFGRAHVVPPGDHDGIVTPPADFSRENYGQLTDQPWKSPWDEALSTFSIDVDTASYTNVRRMIREGRPVQADAVRIEEMINYFDYRYPAPEGESPFAVGSQLATCPWQPEHLLARVSIKGREIDKNARPASNLVFLIDVSGSMQSPDKLPMLKRAMTTLVNSLDERDRVGIVVYAGTEGVALSPTELTEEGKSEALRAIGKLESGGSTNGGAGISRAYRMALEHMVDGGVNRVILATDGDFNVGTTGQGELVDLVKGNAAKGVSLTVLGFGTGNLNDAMLEAISNDGNGNSFYVDSDMEARRVFEQKLTGTLVTIAKDVKIQVEFNPGKVKAYRLIGYANRVLRNQDFNNDTVDAGDIGAGHTVTAFYEIVPTGVKSPFVGDVDELKYQRPADRREVVESDDWYTLKLRYKHPEGEKSRLITTPVIGEPVAWEEADRDFRMASAVALFGMKLRGMEEVEEISWDKVEEIAKPALADDLDERRAGFLELVRELE